MLRLGASWERPGASRERPKRGHTSHRAYRNSMKEQTLKFNLHLCNAKSNIFQKTTSSTTILACPWASWAGMSSRCITRVRSGASGEPPAWAYPYRVLQSNQKNIFGENCKKQRTRRRGRIDCAARGRLGGDRVWRTHIECLKNKKSQLFRKNIKKSTFIGNLERRCQKRGPPEGVP